MRKEESDKTKKEKTDAVRLAQVYEMVTDFQEQSHLRNRRRIRAGLWCLCIVPAVFLLLLLVTDSSKILFLVLWIISLFGIAIYLIAVEYMDYHLQKQMSR